MLSYKTVGNNCSSFVLILLIVMLFLFTSTVVSTSGGHWLANNASLTLGGSRSSSKRPLLQMYSLSSSVVHEASISNVMSSGSCPRRNSLDSTPIHLPDCSGIPSASLCSLRNLASNHSCCSTIY